MAKRINTCDEFLAALQQIPFARDRLPELDWMITSNVLPGRCYDLWHQVLSLVREAITAQDWASVGQFLKLYDAVQLAGKKGEMWEGSYVAFLEDLRLPTDPAELHKFWQVCPRVFLKDIQKARRITRG